MIKPKISEKTVAAKFKRLAYFHGQLLTEQDLLEEQVYFREKLKLHNRLHGKGIVRGLEVIPSSWRPASTCEDQAGPSIVVIQPGIALDCEGNEVIVCRPYFVNLTDTIEFLERVGAVDPGNCTCEPVAGEPIRITVGITFGECCSNPVTQYITTCSSDVNKQYSRVREGFSVVIGIIGDANIPKPSVESMLTNSCGASTYKCPGVDPDCSNDMVIPLARILVCKGKNEDDNTITKISASKIITTGVRQYAWSAETFDTWDEARKKMLSPDRVILRDISGILNLPFSQAKVFLERMGMIVEDKSLIPSELTKGDWEKIRSLSSIIPEGEKITLITDNHNDEKVLFGLLDRKVDTSGVRQYAWTAEKYVEWDEARKKILSPGSIFLHDISDIINLPISEAQVILKRKGMIVEEKLLIVSELTKDDKDIVKILSPIVPEGTRITLIIDDSIDKKVLFGLPDRKAEDVSKVGKTKKR